MLFSSLTFILGFLPLTIASVYIAAKRGGPRAAVPVLLAASLIFYAWQTPAYIFLITGSIIANYALGRAIAKTRLKAMLAFGVVLNLALLGWFKYIGLFSSTLSDLARAELTIDGVVLPLAISFFTFQQIAYLVDCHEGKVERYGFLTYALFVAFFPQLIAGPIVHHKTVTPQFSGPRFAAFIADDIAAGVFLLSIGLAKKVLIADALAPLADGVFDAAAAGVVVAGADAWIGVFAYSFQIYFDFSGYCDMAMGLALLFGVRLPMNFNSPYKARSIVDFWRRWHITLSTFLRDYLYIPLGGNRKGRVLRYRNLFIVMLLGGLWHGAAWTFVAWGALHGAYLCINHAWEKSVGKRVHLSPVSAMALTFGATSLAWVFFRATDFHSAFALFASLMGLNSGTGSVLPSSAVFSYPILFLAAVITFAAPNAMALLSRFQTPAREPTAHGAGANAQTRAGAAAFRVSPLAMAGLGALAACALFILMSSGPYEFIYFQF